MLPLLNEAHPASAWRHPGGSPQLAIDTGEPRQVPASGRPRSRAWPRATPPSARDRALVRAGSPARSRAAGARRARAGPRARGERDRSARRVATTTASGTEPGAREAPRATWRARPPGDVRGRVPPPRAAPRAAPRRAGCLAAGGAGRRRRFARALGPAAQPRCALVVPPAAGRRVSPRALRRARSAGRPRRRRCTGLRRDARGARGGAPSGAGGQRPRARVDAARSCRRPRQDRRAHGGPYAATSHLTLRPS